MMSSSNTSCPPASGVSALGSETTAVVLSSALMHRGEDQSEIHSLLPAVLSRLAAGLPMCELDVIIKEARACEDAL